MLELGDGRRGEASQGAEDLYSVIGSCGGYVYYWNSKYQYVFWPLIDEHVLYACQKCHFTCLMDQFDNVPKDKIQEIRKAFEGTKLSPPEREPPLPRCVAERIADKIVKNQPEPLPVGIKPQVLLALEIRINSPKKCQGYKG